MNYSGKLQRRTERLYSGSVNTSIQSISCWWSMISANTFTSSVYSGSLLSVSELLLLLMNFSKCLFMYMNGRESDDVVR